MEEPKGEYNASLSLDLSKFGLCDRAAEEMLGHGVWQEFDWHKPKDEMKRILSSLGSIKVGYPTKPNEPAKMYAFRVEDGKIIEYGCAQEREDPMPYFMNYGLEMADQLHPDQRQPFLTVLAYLRTIREMCYSPGEPKYLFEPRIIEAPLKTKSRFVNNTLVPGKTTMRKHTVKGIRSEPTRRRLILISNADRELRMLEISVGLTEQLHDEIHALAAVRRQAIADRHMAMGQLHRIITEQLTPWLTLSAI